MNTPTTELMKSIDTALMQGEVFRRGILALSRNEEIEGGMIQAGKDAWKDYRAHVNTLEDQLTRLRAFVEKVANQSATNSDVIKRYGGESTIQLVFDWNDSIGEEARELLTATAQPAATGSDVSGSGDASGEKTT